MARINPCNNVCLREGMSAQRAGFTFECFHSVGLAHDLSFTIKWWVESVLTSMYTVLPVQMTFGVGKNTLECNEKER